MKYCDACGVKRSWALSPFSKWSLCDLCQRKGVCQVAEQSDIDRWEKQAAERKEAATT